METEDKNKSLCDAVMQVIRNLETRCAIAESAFAQMKTERDSFIRITNELLEENSDFLSRLALSPPVPTAPSKECIPPKGVDSKTHPLLRSQLIACREIVNITISNHGTQLVEVLRHGDTNSRLIIDCEQIERITDHKGDVLLQYREYFTPECRTELEKEFAEF